jgi:hypothetical protein
LPENSPGRHGAPDDDHSTLGVEEEDIEREAHPKGVDAGAARDQQARPGVGAVPEGEPAQSGSEILCNGDGKMSMIHAPLSALAGVLSPLPRSKIDGR